MKQGFAALMLILLAGILAGCGASAAASAPGSGQASAAAATPQPYTSAVLLTTYQDALPANMQLALGTLKLEGTPDAVTPDQAKTLLPLWQAIQSGAAATDAETNAVLKQIEGAMQSEQLKAIAAMQLTRQALTAYAQANGLAMQPPPGALATGQPGGGQASPDFGNMTDAQRQAFRATAQAGGFGGGQGGPDFANMTDAQRQAFRATAEASGFGGPRTGGGGSGFLTVLAKSLVDLLTQRAAQ